MGVGTWVNPDHQTQDGSTFKLNIKNSFMVAQRLAAVFAPHEQAVPNMTVRLDAGAIFTGGALTEIAAQSTGTITAPSANPRIDRVVIDQVTGAVSVVTGTEAASPSPPAIPSGKLPVAQVALSTTTTEITNSLITDERVGIGGGGSTGGIPRLAKTGNYTLTSAENGKEIACTGTLTIFLIAGATADYHAWIRNAGTGLVTVDGNGASIYGPSGGSSKIFLWPGMAAHLEWDGSSWHVISDVALGSFFRGPAPPPTVQRTSGSVLTVVASADAPVGVEMAGFPNFLNPGAFLTGDITDGRYRQNTTDATLDMTQAASRWGNAKDNQWYMVYALAAAAASGFALKAMPVFMFSSQAGQVITLRNSANNGDIGYGFTANELAAGKIFILTGDHAGAVRPITANNADNGTAGTITYGGTTLASLNRGDWFAVLPPGTNFRWVRNFFYKTTGGNPDLDDFEQAGDWTTWKTAKAYDYKAIDPMSALLMKETGLIVFRGRSSIYPTDAPTGIWGYAYAPGLR